MAWRIHSFCPETGAGTVVSAYFGPWAFGPGENPSGTRDFEIGERVRVELDGSPGSYVVRSVVPERRRQPEGTACAAFAELNEGRLPDLRVQASDERALRLWVGDCCERCGPWWSVRFTNPVTVGWNEDVDLDSPLFRYASEAELEDAALTVPSGRRAYAVVSGDGDGPRALIVAEAVELELHPHDPQAWRR